MLILATLNLPFLLCLLILNSIYLLLVRVGKGFWIRPSCCGACCAGNMQTRHRLCLRGSFAAVERGEESWDGIGMLESEVNEGNLREMRRRFCDNWRLYYL